MANEEGYFYGIFINPPPHFHRFLRQVGLKLCNPASRRPTLVKVLISLPARASIVSIVTSFSIWGLVISVGYVATNFHPLCPSSRGPGGTAPCSRHVVRLNYNLVLLPALSSKRFRKAISTSSVKSLAWRLRPRLAKARRELS